MRYIFVILALCCATTAFADTILWKGNINGFWDTTTANWTADAGGRNDGYYADGDHVTFDDTAIRVSLSLNAAVDPGSILVDADAKEYFFNTPGNTAFTGGTLLTKRGTSTLHLETSGPCNAHTGGVEIVGGTVLSEFHFCGGDMGNGPVFLNGGTWSAFGIKNEGTGRDIFVKSNSTMHCRVTLGTGKNGNHITSKLVSDPGTVLTVTDVAPGTPLRFEGGSWFANLVDDDMSSIVLSGGGGLRVDNGILELSVTGRHTEAEYVLLDYSDGVLAGPFLAENGIPPGWTLDLDGTVENPFSYVLINPNPAPAFVPPSAFLTIY